MVLNREGTKAENVINLNAESNKLSERENIDEDKEFNVAVEGLNRLP